MGERLISIQEVAGPIPVSSTTPPCHGKKDNYLVINPFEWAASRRNQHTVNSNSYRDVAQLGRALDLGSRGRESESHHSDQICLCSLMVKQLTCNHPMAVRFDPEAPVELVLISFKIGICKQSSQNMGRQFNWENTRPASGSQEFKSPRVHQWGCSSIGRASVLQTEGCEFKSRHVPPASIILITYWRLNDQICAVRR